MFVIDVDYDVIAYSHEVVIIDVEYDVTDYSYDIVMIIIDVIENLMWFFLVVNMMSSMNHTK